VLQVIDMCQPDWHNPDSPHHRVADYLGLGLVSAQQLVRRDQLPDNGSEPPSYLLVVNRPEDLQVVPQVCATFPVLCIVTWLLPEEHIQWLLNNPQLAQLHIEVGMPPNPQQFHQRMNSSLDPERRQQQLQQSTDLYLLQREIESLMQRLSQPAA